MLRHVTNKLKCVLLPTQSKSDKATRQAKSLRTNRIIHPTFHLFMRLPKELRLMIYDNIIGTTRRQLPLTNARIYYDYLHSAILQTCKQVAEEAGPILHRRRIEILGPPVLTIRINPNRYDSALYFIKHLLKLIGECRAAEIEETGASANVILPWLFSGDKDRNIRIGTLFSVELSQSSPITNGRKFQDFFQRTMRHMRRQSTVVVRLLVDGLFRTHPFNNMEFWSETAVDLEQYSRMINFRFVFVVPKQQLESYKGLAVRPRSVPPWITEDMWSVEAAKRGGVDPAVD